MSKKIKQKNGLSEHLSKKQVFDIISLLIIFIVMYVIVEFCQVTDVILGGVLILLFCLAVIVFEGTKNSYKKKTDSILNDLLEKAEDDTKKMGGIAAVQKENMNLSFAKITNAKNMVENLKNISAELNAVIEQTKGKALNSLNYTNSEYDTVKENIEKMFTIRHKIQTIAELILELSDYIQSISATIGLVEDIAEQTNLLALNAAVEAARAGEHGKGFAIVAGEIRKLADESKQATSKITALITNIQQTANSTVLATEEGTKEVESGIELAHNIAGNIEQLILITNEISQGINDITASSSKIEANSKNTDLTIDEIDSMLKTNYKITEESFKNIENLEAISKSFKTNVNEE